MQAAQLKADGKAQRVIVTGCLAQRYSEDLAGKVMILLHLSDLRPWLPMQLTSQLLIIGSCFTIAHNRELFSTLMGVGSPPLLEIEQTVLTQHSCIGSDIDALLP